MCKIPVPFFREAEVKELILIKRSSGPLDREEHFPPSWPCGQLPGQDQKVLVPSDDLSEEDPEAGSPCPQLRGCLELSLLLAHSWTSFFPECGPWGGTPGIRPARSGPPLIPGNHALGPLHSRRPLGVAVPSPEQGAQMRGVGIRRTG